MFFQKWKMLHVHIFLTNCSIYFLLVLKELTFSYDIFLKIMNHQIKYRMWARMTLNSFASQMECDLLLKKKKINGFVTYPWPKGEMK